MKVASSLHARGGGGRSNDGVAHRDREGPAMSIELQAGHLVEMIITPLNGDLDDHDSDSQRNHDRPIRSFDRGTCGNQRKQTTASHSGATRAFPCFPKS